MFAAMAGGTINAIEKAERIAKNFMPQDRNF